MSQRARTVLAIHDGHNASVCVLRNGQVSYLVQEERLRYKKNFWGYPARAVAHAIEYCGLDPQDVDLITFGTERRVVRKDRTLEEILYSFERILKPSGFLRAAAIHYGKPILQMRPNRAQTVRDTFLDEISLVDRPQKGFNHHKCHAAAAYYAMRQDPESPHLVLTLDGAGERNCATVWVGRDGRLEPIAQTPNGNSPGTIYALVTFLMGFIPYEHEYKLMGMAPYCAPARAEKAAALFSKHVGLSGDGLRFERRGSLPLNMRMRQILRDMRMQRFDVIAAGLQKFCEDLVVAWVQRCIAHTGIKKVVCGGGVFMNVKANKLLMELPEVEYLGVLPSCGDESLSYGAAALGHCELGDHRDLLPWNSIYFGPDIRETDAERAIRGTDFHCTRPDDIEAEIARLLVSGHPVARCRGRMEYGARALGNRSILADPSRQDCVRVINQMVKKRDFWMPFAPMIIEERMNEYLVNPKNFPSPHMMLSFDTRENFREFIAAVHNADLTARAQTLREDQNPEMYRCLQHFERLTGRGVVLNTSFNLHGYPVCLGPEEALHVMENSGLEFLALGPFMVSKRPVSSVLPPEEKTAGRSRAVTT